MTQPVIIGDATLYLGDKRKRKGVDSPLYKGGKSKDSNGYVVFTSGPNINKREHRVVMEAHLGRALGPDEVVHHVNGIKDDNRIENLKVESRASHNREHGKGEVVACSRCGTGKWYSPAAIKKITDRTKYKCRACWSATGGNASCMKKS